MPPPARGPGVGGPRRPRCPRRRGRGPVGPACPPLPGAESGGGGAWRGRGGGGRAAGSPLPPRRQRSAPERGGSGGRTMESRPEEFELNGDLRPGSPGSPDASVSPAPPAPLCDLGRRPPSLGPAPAAPRAPGGAADCAPLPHCGVPGRPVPSVRAVAPGLRPPRQGRGSGREVPTPSRAVEGPGRHLPPPSARASNFGPRISSRCCAPGRAGSSLRAPGQQRADGYVTRRVHRDRSICCVPRWGTWAGCGPSLSPPQAPGRWSRLARGRWLGPPAPESCPAVACALPRAQHFPSTSVGGTVPGMALW